MWLFPLEAATSFLLFYLQIGPLTCELRPTEVFPEFVQHLFAFSGEDNLAGVQVDSYRSSSGSGYLTGDAQRFRCCDPVHDTSDTQRKAPGVTKPERFPLCIYFSCTRPALEVFAAGFEVP